MIFFTFLAQRYCAFVCTFDHECDFHKNCKNGRCVEDNTVKWLCISGQFDSPRMACKRKKSDHGWYNF